MDSIKTKILIIEKKINEINNLEVQFLKNENIIHDEAIRCINFSCSEGAFIHIISWLYVKYFDNKLSKENIKYILGYMQDNKFESFSDLSLHKKIVEKMRTFLHHDLKKDNKSNRSTKKISNEWFRNQCFLELPISDDDWKKCLNKILDGSLHFFTQIYVCLDLIFKDEQKEIILSQWEKYIVPFSLYDVQMIITEISKVNNINVNPHEYAHKNYDQFISSLREKGLENSENELKKIILKKMASELL